MERERYFKKVVGNKHYKTYVLFYTHLSLCSGNTRINKQKENFQS